MFEFLGLLFEAAYTTLVDLLYSIFIAPIRMIYYLCMEYIVANDLDPVAIAGLIISVVLIFEGIMLLRKLFQQLVVFGVTAYRNKVHAAKREKVLRLQKKRQEWAAYDREFDELYQKYAVSDNSEK